MRSARRWLRLGLVVLALLTSLLLVHRAQSALSPVVRTSTVGLFPTMVVVDARTHRVFVANTADATVSVLDATSGAVLRTTAVGSAPGIMAADVRTNRVFDISDAGDTITVLDARDGTALRMIDAPGVDAATDEHTGHLVVAAVTELDLRDGATGAVLTTDTFAGVRVHANAVAVDAPRERAFSANWGDDTISMVDTRSGRLLRTVHVGHLPVAVAVDDATGRVFSANNGGGTVSMLDAHSGALLRTVPVGPHPAKVVVDARSGRVFVVQGRGGNRQQFHWNDPRGDAGFPDIRQGGTTMLDARTGAVLGTAPVGGSAVDDLQTTATTPPTVAVDTRRSRVFVIDQATDDGQGRATSRSISVLDARSGRLLRHIAVGRNPMALAVDEATARLFVVNTNSGCARSRDAWAWLPGAVRHWVPFVPPPRQPVCGGPGSVSVIDTTRV